MPSLTPQDRDGQPIIEIEGWDGNGMMDIQLTAAELVAQLSRDEKIQLMIELDKYSESAGRKTNILIEENGRGARWYHHRADFIIERSPDGYRLLKAQPGFHATELKVV